MNKIGKPLIWIFAVLLVLVIGKNLLAQVAVSAGVKAITGLDLTLGKLDLGLLSGKIDIKDLHLSNPKGFEEKTMVNLPEIFVKADLPSIIKGKIHVEDLRIHLKEFHVIKSKDGVLNLDALTAVAASKGEKPKAAEKKEAKPMNLQIDHLSLKVEKVTYVDHSVLGKTVSKDFNVNIDEEFNDITNPNALVAIIVSKALMNTTIGQLANIDLGAISDVGAQALESGKRLATDAGNQAKQALGSVTETVNTEKAKELASATTDSAKEAAGALKDTASGFLGSMKSKVTGE
ncbi:AsmA family protein [Omnitrophica bacterium]|nr:AsmA family protein [Candidatus Omnitrophota bacterium]